MGGNIDSRQGGIPKAQAVAAPQSTFQELIDEYPELADDINALTAPLDAGQPDRHSKGFSKQYPGMEPQL